MWCRRGYVHPPQPLPEDDHGLYPDFNLEVAEASARDFYIFELTQAVFYTMMLNNAMALGFLCAIIADALTPVLECLNWGTFKSWLKTQREALLRAHN